MDALPVRRTEKGRGVAFLTGCHDCGLLFSNPLPTPAELDQFYAADGTWAAARAERTRYIEKKHASQRKRTRPSTKVKRRPREVLIDAVTASVRGDTAAGAKVLDFGCGDGKFLNRLQDRGWETYGIEPSSDLAFHRHRRLDAPPKDASFDLVILHHVLEHVIEPLDLLRQLAGATRPGGSLFISVPRLDTLPEHGDLRYCINGRTHPICLSEPCLRTLLARAGFATTARLDGAELDAALSDGKPLRLRLLATRTAAVPAAPETPLDSALDALAQHARGRGSLAFLAREMLPVRLRAALIAWRRVR